MPLTAEQRDLLSLEPAYPLEVHLLTPKDHPLARRRVVRPQDLSHYPILNRPPAVSPNPFARIILQLQNARRPGGDLLHTGLLARSGGS
jgi:hypothetical protein